MCIHFSAPLSYRCLEEPLMVAQDYTIKGWVRLKAIAYNTPGIIPERSQVCCDWSLRKGSANGKRGINCVFLLCRYLCWNVSSTDGGS
jgi:hypothetical protein